AMAAFLESASDGDHLDVQPTSTSADPFEGFCRRMTVFHRETRLLIERIESQLRIGGSRADLGQLARTMRQLATTGDPKDHVHFEYFEGDWRLEPESIPLIILRE
ncbi:MAG TPA: hypothetical protein VEB21_16315, partial [Terriglobales bacterium]|nr:hypothetical protein [Terriglobales bacterium]